MDLIQESLCLVGGYISAFKTRKATPEPTVRVLFDRLKHRVSFECI